MFRLGSLLVGGLIGAAVALLVSPRNGEEVRRDLKNRLNERYGNRLEKGRLRATEFVKSGREMLDERLTYGQDLVNTAIERARTTIDEVAEPRTPGNGSHIGAGPDEAVDITAEADRSAEAERASASGTTGHQQY